LIIFFIAISLSDVPYWGTSSTQMHHNQQNRESDGFQQNFTSKLQLKNTVARNCGDDIFYN